MKTLPQNYARNVEILKENLKRGMSVTTASNHVKQMEQQFVNAGVYDEDERQFINEMRSILFTASTGIEIIKGDQ